MAHLEYLSLSILPDLFAKIAEELQQSIKRYEKFPPEIRFLMLVDKLHIIVLSNLLISIHLSFI